LSQKCVLKSLKPGGKCCGVLENDAKREKIYNGKHNVSKILVMGFLDVDKCNDVENNQE
jgi:hypothetical protein